MLEIPIYTVRADVTIVSKQSTESDIAQNLNLKNLTQGCTRNTMTLKHVKSAQHNVPNLPSQKTNTSTNNMFTF